MLIVSLENKINDKKKFKRKAKSSAHFVDFVAHLPTTTSPIHEIDFVIFARWQIVVLKLVFRYFDCANESRDLINSSLITLR